MELLIIAILLTFTGAQDSQLEGPQNTLSVVGSNATLTCLSPSRNCRGIEWLKLTDASSKTVLNHHGIITSEFKERHNVDNASRCDLVINNVELTDAGRFLCRATISSKTVEKSAHLIILETQSKCTINNHWNETVEGDELLLNCTVTYNGTSRASIVWKETGDVLKVVEKGKPISLSEYVVASAPEVPSFTCIISFPLETEDNGVAIIGLTKNIPTTTCATSVIKVLPGQQFQVEGPENTLSIAGSNVTLKCLSPSRNCSGIDWMKYSPGSLTTVFKAHVGIMNHYGQRYSVDEKFGCNLVIKNVELTDAGRFICSAVASTRIIEKTAYLIILETKPKCTTKTYWHELKAGDDVQLNCLVTYDGANRASMVWQGAGDTPVVVENGKTISRSDYVVASAPEVQSFTCITSFAVVTKYNNGAPIGGLAKNIVNTTCATSAIKVLSAQHVRVEEPQNTLSVVGSTVIFKCLSPSTSRSRIEWQKCSAGSPTTDSTNCVGISSAFGGRYSVDGSSDSDLVIKNVQLTDAGLFGCTSVISTRTIEKTAYLIILETQPKCTIYASLDDTFERDGVQLNCMMAYNDRSKISMVWKGVDDAPAAKENGNSLIWSYYVVASAPEVPSFTCIISSMAVETKDNNGAKIRGLAANIPNTTCATSAIKVLHSVRDVQLSPSLPIYSPGSRIICMAKGHPNPTLKWQELANDGIWTDIQNQNGCEFSVGNVSSKWYRCFAMNVVRSESYYATSLEFLVNNTDSDYNDSLTATETPPPPPSNIMASVAVGAAFAFLLITLPIHCFFLPACPGYKYWHSENNTKGKTREELPMIEIPDTYGNENQVQDALPKSEPRSAPTSDLLKRPKVAPPQAMPRTDNPEAGRGNP